MKTMSKVISLMCLIALFAQAHSKLDCDALGRKVSENMNKMSNTGETSKLIKPEDCSFAKSNVILTYKYSACLPSYTGGAMHKVYSNMRQAAKMICQNVNRRIMPCFSQENVRQFRECTNRTLQYMSYIRSAPKKTKTLEVESESASNFDAELDAELAKPNLADGNTRSKRRPQSSDGEVITSSVPKKGPKPAKTDDSLTSFAGADGISRRRKRETGELTEYEHSCCMMHLNSDCFLSKVLHHCADSTQLRTVSLLKTMVNFVVRDFVDVVCGRIESLEQCKQYTDSLDDGELGFR